MNNDPNYAWTILPDAVATEMYAKLDPIVDHKNVRTEDLNSLAEWVDDLRTSSYTQGSRDGVKHLRAAICTIASPVTMRNYKPDDIPEDEWLVCVMGVLHALTDTDRGRPMPWPDEFYGLVRLSHETIYGKAATHG